MLFRGPALNPLVFRCFLSFALLASCGDVLALGLGELRGQPNLGDKLRLEIDVLGEGRAALDANCFRLVAPAVASDLPWLKKAALSLRKAGTPVLEIRSEAPLREPILQLAVQVGCGHEISREYMLLASPPTDRPGPIVRPAVVGAGTVSDMAPPVVSRPRSPRARADVSPPDLPMRPRMQRDGRASRPSVAQDRVLLSSGEGEAEPSLRLSTELVSMLGGGKEAKEAQREMLRLEFRMLMAMNAQATSQLETAEKLRNMEATLGDLQQRAADFSQRAEGIAEAVAPKFEPSPSIARNPPAGIAPAVPVDEASWLSEWSLYGVIFGALLGVGGWLGWRNYRERQLVQVDSEMPFAVVEPQVDPQREGEDDGVAHVDFALGAAPGPSAMQVDFELDLPHDEVPKPLPSPPPSMSADSVLSISATTLDEHFEANPVMELADIMLSFGRVKGAAQALQEYIDNNPQEALQPWIRLMDVYRMAGMRNEFEEVARNLNQNFNVEVQQWELAQSSATRHSLDLVLDETVESAIPIGPRPERLEDLPRLMSTVTELWAAGDVVGYLYQLLRDNRGGKRVGFSLPVVEEILFLVELKETSNRMVKEDSASA